MSDWQVVGFVFALAGCGGAQHAAAAPLRPLEESRAIDVILEAFQRAGVTPELHRRIGLAGGRQMEIDVATAGHDHGVEYIQEQDRLDFGDALPQRQHPDSLLTCVGVGEDARVDVLLVEDRDFRYEPDPSRSGPGRPTNIEVEDRLRQTVVDYLTYLRQHGQL
jgi:hypothetical protein